MCRPQFFTYLPLQDAPFTPEAVTRMTNRVDDARRSNIRSAHVDVLLAQIAEQAEVQPDSLEALCKAAEGAVCSRNMGIAITTFDLFRCPDAPEQEHPSTQDWVLSNSSVFSDLDRLREFLQLAESINRLTIAYLSVPDAEQYWSTLYSKYITDVDDIVLFLGRFEDLARPQSWTHRLCISGIVRRILRKLAIKNPPGQVPTDLGGQTINYDHFSSLQGHFWRMERDCRGQMLAELDDRGVIELGTAFDKIVLWERERKEWDTEPFLKLLTHHRFDTAISSLGLSNRQANKLLELLILDEATNLGVQGMALLLPQDHEDSYTLQHVFELAALSTQVATYFECFPPDDRTTWCDGWFKRSPVAFNPVTNNEIL
ncbi:hypothetical protein FDECE_4015 [Fusarium decemcellulare]|nr:hypothetical protein FDECE_4015 [Fusarium decemcellulare]